MEPIKKLYIYHNFFFFRGFLRRIDPGTPPENVGWADVCRVGLLLLHLHPRDGGHLLHGQVRSHN